MKILILGSTGGTGQQLVLQSLEHNYEVTALARDPSKLNTTHAMLTVIKGDVLDKSLLAQIITGKDAVISALGVGRSLKSGDLMANAVNLLIPAMIEKNVSRLILLSAFGVGETFAQASFIQKLVFRLPLRNMYADKAKADEQVRNSKLDWTLVYPVLLTNKPGTGKYKVGEKMPMTGMSKISRADVADFMVRQLADNSYIRKSPIIMN
jgi:putative NADH-flavin reductase